MPKRKSSKKVRTPTFKEIVSNAKISRFTVQVKRQDTSGKDALNKLSECSINPLERALSRELKIECVVWLHPANKDSYGPLSFMRKRKKDLYVDIVSSKKANTALYRWGSGVRFPPGLYTFRVLGVQRPDADYEDR